MQQRIRDVARALIVGTLALIAGSPSIRAGEQTTTQNSPNLPVLLLVIENAPNAKAQQDDLDARLKTTLREALNKTNRLQVHSFLPSDSIIKRALNEHLIAADDLVAPYKQESLHRIAKAIGARYILRLSTALDRTEVRTDMRYMDNPNVSDWVVLADDHVRVPFTIGKKRLKMDDIVNLTVDSITARIGTPTHLAGKLPLMPDPRVMAEIDRTGKKAKRDSRPKTGNPAQDTHVGEVSTPETAGGGDTERPAARSAKASPRDKKRQEQASALTKSDNGSAKSAQNSSNTSQSPVFTNEADPAHIGLPALPAVAPPPVAAKPDYQAQAVRYRQTGDLTNSVIALRRAVNERPRDVNLRRQLIQAYQIRQMPEAAHAEALRALQLDANNAALYRLYGEVLMAQGDLPGAMQAFRDGTRVDPADVACQVALGDALLASNQYADALTAYDAASKSDSKSPLPHRRLARALAARAGTDPAQYKASLAEIQRANELTLPTDTASSLEDYVGLMRILEGRLRDLLVELQSAYQAKVQSKRTNTELLRQTADMKERANALADYLDRLPPAVGQDVTQAHYTQSNALLLQAIGFFKDMLSNNDDRLADSMKSGEVQAQRELTTASQRLNSVKTIQENGVTAPPDKRP